MGYICQSGNNWSLRVRPGPTSPTEFMKWGEKK